MSSSLAENRGQAFEKTADHDSRPFPAPPEFLDLKAQFASIREETMAAISGVMESQRFILGSEVRLLEEEIAAKLGAKHAVACASGSDALVLALMSLNIGAGDEVITTPFTFVATAGSIARTGARPVFVDIERETFNIDPDKIEGAITPRTRAIIPVHLFGLTAEILPIVNLAKTHNLAVIEDAAQAIGARHQAQCAGTFGNLGCFSFFPSKNLGCAGDGGLITTEEETLASRLRLLRAHGSSSKYRHEILGMNSRLDALQAAILRVKLRHLDAWTEQRARHASCYRALFESAGLDHITVPKDRPAAERHAYNQFTIRSNKRDDLRQFLRSAGIPTEIYYPLPLHLQPAFSYLGYREGEFPESERASQEVLSLPIYPELSVPQIESVVRAISQFYRSAN